MKRIFEIYEIDSSKTLIIIICRILQAIVPTLQILAIGKILDMAAQRKFELKLFLVLMICMSYSILCDSIMNFLWISLRNKIEEANEAKLVQTLIHTNYEYLENEDIQDRLKRVHTKSAEALSEYFESFMVLVAMILRIAGVFAILLQFSIVGALLILITFGPVIWFSVQSGKKQFLIDSDNTVFERHTDYLEQILSSREAADERYLFQYFSVVLKRWNFFYQQQIRNKIKGIRIWFLKSKTSSLLAAFAILVVLGYMLNVVIRDGNQIGLYISVASSLLGLIYMIATEFSRSLDKLANTDSVLKDRAETYLLLENNKVNNENKADSRNEEIQEIEFRNVSFRYPGMDADVLKGVSFRIKKGESIALVGENGAGKTTIVNLLTGLYTGYQGEILWNGKQICCQHSFPYEEYISVVNQNFVRYPLTIRENIMIGNLEKSADDSAVNDVLGMVDLQNKVSSLPTGIDTVLGKLHEDGVDLSGGEWQRLTIARMLFANKPVQILDEPTAAMDPLAEAEIYHQFGRLLQKDKLTIMISHRLGSVKNATKILVLRDGKIVEQGEHQELMDKQGDYAKMYDTQSGWYL